MTQKEKREEEQRKKNLLGLALLLLFAYLFVTGFFTWIVETFTITGRAGEETQTFFDVPRSNPDYNKIESLYQKGIILPCYTNPLRFCPDDTITRAELATFIAKAMNIKPIEKAEPTFVDLPKRHWANTYIEAIHEAGKVKPCIYNLQTNEKYFCPDEWLDKQKTAKFFVDALDFTLLNKSKPTFDDVPIWAPDYTNIETLYAHGIAEPCGKEPLRYCPSEWFSRAKAVVWITKAFQISEQIQTKTEQKQEIKPSGEISLPQEGKKRDLKTSRYKLLYKIMCGITNPFNKANREACLEAIE